MDKGIDNNRSNPYDGYQVAQGSQRTAPAGAQKGTTMDHLENAPISDIVKAMQKGGSFMSSLADALIRSDAINAQRILDTWHDDILEAWVMFGKTKKYFVDITVEVEAEDADDAWDRAFVDGSVVEVHEPIEADE